MRTKILSSFIFIMLAASMFSGCGGNNKEQVYDLSDSIVVNVGNKYLKLELSLKVKDEKEAADNLARILDKINTALSSTEEGGIGESLKKMSRGETDITQNDIKEGLKKALAELNIGIEDVYFRAFVLQ